MCLCRELARKYGSASLSPHMPLDAPQPEPWQDQSAVLPRLGAHVAASDPGADAAQPSFLAELQVSSAKPHADQSWARQRGKLLKSTSKS